MPNRRVKNCPALNLPNSKRSLVWNENPAPKKDLDWPLNEPTWPISDEEIKARIWAIFEPYIQIAKEREKRERNRR